MRKLIIYAIPIFLVLSFASMAQAQEKFYDLSIIKQIKTSPTKDLQRPASCWSNAGIALLEAEWIKSGKPEIDLSEMHFIRAAYQLKADAYFNSKGAVRLDEKLIAPDVLTLLDKYGMVPEEMFMISEQKPTDARSGEMDAILRGTLQMVMEKQEGNFTERWQNTYNAALSRYLGEPRYKFSYNNTEYDARTFAESSGIKTSDFVILTSDSRSKPNEKIEVPAKNNWNKSLAFNVLSDQIQNAMRGSINAGHTIVWYGNLPIEMIYAEENVALVPMEKLENVTNPAEGEEKSFAPFPEKEISDAERQMAYETMTKKDLDYLLIVGLSQDKLENQYFTALKVCETGNKILHLTPSFVKLNTGFILMNKNGLPKDLKTELGL